jgi:hypothetical protein
MPVRLCRSVCLARFLPLCCRLLGVYVASAVASLILHVTRSATVLSFVATHGISASLSVILAAAELTNSCLIFLWVAMPVTV